MLNSLFQQLHCKANHSLSCQDKTWLVLPGLTAKIGYHDYDNEINRLFIKWLNHVNFSEQRQQLFDGTLENASESKNVFHTRARALGHIDKHNSINKQLLSTFDSMCQFAHAIHNPTSVYGLPPYITDIIHIGIGGSVFGPMLVEKALGEFRCFSASIHYVSYMDHVVLSNLLSKLNPATTVFLLVSKSFATEEMLFQADVAKKWLMGSRLRITKHFIAITAQPERAGQWGVSPELILQFPQGIGGRFSLWSAVGLSTMISLGEDNFKQLLQGAYQMDLHFQQAPLSKNLPVRLAFLSAWYTQFKQYHTHAIIPYHVELAYLPLYLQQMHMESLGKSIDIDQQPVKHLACPVIFGDVGTRSQHALSQYFMQAPACVPLDIIMINEQRNESDRRLMAHAQAQADVLWQGYEPPIGQPWRAISGRRPSTSIILDKLDPYHLGALLALYEQKVFTLACLYRINAFDQWGVERGKDIADKYFQRSLD